MNPQQPLTATGRNGTLTFDGHTVTINRKGALARITIGKGEKRIPVHHITAVQIKPAGAVMDGFIQFTLAGGIERRSRFGQQSNDARTDENTIMFWRKDQPAFEAIQRAIEAAQRAQHAPAPTAAADLPSQLTRLADLYKSGALSAEEYAAAKSRLIG